MEVVVDGTKGVVADPRHGGGRQQHWRHVTLEVLDPDRPRPVRAFSRRRFAVCLAATEVFVVLLLAPRGTQSISLSEIPLVVGLAFTPSRGACCSPGSSAPRNRHRPQAAGAKLAFNLVRLPLEAARDRRVTLVLGDESRGPRMAGLRDHRRTLLLEASSVTTISAAFAHGGGRNWAELGGRSSRAQPPPSATQASRSSQSSVLDRDVRAAWLLIVVRPVLHIAYRAYTTLGHGHTHLERLYGFTESEVGRSTQAAEVRRRSSPTPDAVDTANKRASSSSILSGPRPCSSWRRTAA